MSNREFHKYPETAFLLVSDMPRGEIFRIYTDRTFALKAAGSNGDVYELPLPALETLKLVERELS